MHATTKTTTFSYNRLGATLFLVTLVNKAKGLPESTTHQGSHQFSYSHHVNQSMSMKTNLQQVESLYGARASSAVKNGLPVSQSQHRPWQHEVTPSIAL